MYVCMYVCTYVLCMYVCMYVCVYVCTVCMYVRMYVCVYVCTWVTCTYVRTYIYCIFISQYPVFFTYCILALLFIYTQPYNVPAANWIEILLSINTILLYTFHLSRKVFDINQNLSYSSGCHESVKTFSTSSIILAFFYYLPFVVTVTVIIFLVG